MPLNLENTAALRGEVVEQATAAPGERRTLTDNDIERIAKAVAEALREVLRLRGA